MRTPVSAFYPRPLPKTGFKTEVVQNKYNNYSAAFNRKRGAKDLRITNSDYVRIKLNNGKISKPHKVQKVFRTFTILENG